MPRKRGVCLFVGCDRPHHVRGLCRKHHQRLLRKRPLGWRPMRESPCSVEGCGNNARALGMCKTHYDRQRRGAALDAPITSKTPQTGRCRAHGCQRRAKTRGYCTSHYRRKQRGETINGAIGRRVGERRVDEFGYARLYTPYGWRFEHRVVMERTLGRRLRPGENVHHRNGRRDDNRPENLELWLTGQPAGQRVEDRIADARRVLELYAA